MLNIFANILNHSLLAFFCEHPHLEGHFHHVSCSHGLVCSLGGVIIRIYFSLSDFFIPDHVGVLFFGAQRWQLSDGQKVSIFIKHCQGHAAIRL